MMGLSERHSRGQWARVALAMPMAVFLALPVLALVLGTSGAELAAGVQHHPLCASSMAEYEDDVGQSGARCDVWDPSRLVAGGRRDPSAELWSWWLIYLWYYRLRWWNCAPTNLWPERDLLGT